MKLESESGLGKMGNFDGHRHNSTVVTDVVVFLIINSKIKSTVFI